MNRSGEQRRAAFLLVVGLLLGAPGLEAQHQRGIRPVGAGRGAAGGSLVLAAPVGDFDNFVDFGGGLNGFVRFHFDDAGLLGLRADGSILIYGSETVRRPFLPRVDVDVTTTNFIFTMGLGPQITLGSGPVQVYLFGTAGFSYFATESGVRGSSNFVEFASTTNFDDFTFALASGGGLLIGLSRGRHPVALDLSTHYLRNGRTRYLSEGSIRDNPDGSITFLPIESDANLMVFKLGVSVGF